MTERFFNGGETYKHMKKKKRMRLTDKKKKLLIQKHMKTGVLLLLLLFVGIVIWKVRTPSSTKTDTDALKPEIDVELLTPNEYSRPVITNEKINGIVVHYTANPGSTAMENRDYFEGLKDTHLTKVSSNFVIGLEGEIVQCIPTWEMAYASNDRNGDTISIECCHPDETGKFNDATYKSLVQLCVWLCVKYDLTAEDVIRHYDVTGKDCPKYFVENEEAWVQFRENIADGLNSAN